MLGRRVGARWEAQGGVVCRGATLAPGVSLAPGTYFAGPAAHPPARGCLPRNARLPPARACAPASAPACTATHLARPPPLRRAPKQSRACGGGCSCRVSGRGGTAGDTQLTRGGYTDKVLKAGGCAACTGLLQQQAAGRWQTPDSVCAAPRARQQGRCPPVAAAPPIRCAPSGSLDLNHSPSLPARPLPHPRSPLAQQQGHRLQLLERRRLDVEGAPPPDEPVGDGAAEGTVGPVVPGAARRRHHVQVAHGAVTGTGRWGRGSARGLVREQGVRAQPRDARPPANAAASTRGGRPAVLCLPAAQPGCVLAHSRGRSSGLLPGQVNSSE